MKLIYCILEEKEEREIERGENGFIKLAFMTGHLVMFRFCINLGMEAKCIEA